MILRVRCTRVGEACKSVKLSISAWIFRLVSVSLSFSDRFLRSGEMLWRNLEGESLSEKPSFADNPRVMSESLFRNALTFEISPHAGNDRQTLSLRFLVCSSFASQKMGTSLSFHWCEKKKKETKRSQRIKYWQWAVQRSMRAWSTIFCTPQPKHMAAPTTGPGQGCNPSPPQPGWLNC